jgi:4-amino-4-deoxy-L-arabinose transferase-like glycosyltransferase
MNDYSCINHRSYDRRNLLIVLLVMFFCLLPFVNKAFHIDDPLFLWSARHILTEPLDFYGYSANWYGTMMPMAKIMQNPPLTSYYIALIARVFGWSEIALHLAFLLPAMLAAIGTYYLARPFCRSAHVAAHGWHSSCQPCSLRSAPIIWQGLFAGPPM